jgi:hypothetical protein
MTVYPPTNNLILNLGDTLLEAISVTVPKGQKFKDVKLVASGSITSFVDSIDPPGGSGPITGEQDQKLVFHVRFRGGIPCKSEPQVVTGTLDVVADRKVVAKKDVKVTVPACPRFVYSAKFVCGEQPDCGCNCAPVQPGRYSTEINIHNYGIKEVHIAKRFIPIVLAGAPAGREPNFVASRAEETIVLPPQTATMDDCCRILQMVLGAPPATPVPLTLGILEIIATAEIAVTAVYTACSGDKGSLSIEVEQIRQNVLTISSNLTPDAG